MSSRPFLRRLHGGLRHPVHAVHYRYRRSQAALVVDRSVRAVRGRAARSLIDRFCLALGWLDTHVPPGGGVPVGSSIALGYPEVTGYLIPSLLAWGERPRADRLGSWLVEQQNADGSWSDPWRTAPYTFDTGQALRGLVALVRTRPELEPAIRRGADWLASQISASGEIVTPSTSTWGVVDGVPVPAAIHLYAVPPLAAAGRMLDERRWDDAVRRARRHYLGGDNPAPVQSLSHFHAYVVAALLDLGAVDQARAAMRYPAQRQRRNGSVPGHPSRRWVDTSAVFQYADIWYRLGDRERADAAFRYGCRRQTSGGGFPGSVGRGPHRDSEVSWPVKYFLDALSSKVRASFDRDAPSYPTEVDRSDGRLGLVLAALERSNTTSVVEFGCGRGRFLRAIQARRPDLALFGLDVSPAMLDGLPPGVVPVSGSLLDLPHADRSVEFAFSVEALEHAVNVPGAIREMSRVMAPGGTLVIIDKNRANLGQMEIEEWEQWFDPDEVAAELRRAGLETTVHRDVPYDGHDGSDGLFVSWVARRTQG